MTQTLSGRIAIAHGMTRTLRTGFGVPGVGVAVWSDGSGEAFGDGRSDVEHGTPFTAATRAPIASTSKAFTGTLLATLVDEGKVRWDEPVRTYLPWLKLRDPAASSQLSLRDMLCHRSGLPDSGGAEGGEQPSSRAWVVEQLGELEPTAPFRGAWQYTNQMYVAAAHVAEVVLSTSWETALAERLLAPLGMAATSSALESTARPYARAADGSLALRPDKPLGIWAPAGGVVSSAMDLLPWLELNITGGMLGQRRLVSDAAFQEVHAMSMPITGWPSVEQARVVGYGMGWCVEDYRGLRRVSHTGGMEGFSSFVGVLPDEGVGVAVLANIEASLLPPVLANVLCDELLHLPAAPWETRYRELAARMAVA